MRHVEEKNLNYDEIIRRGGHNYGDEDFAVLKCPFCARIYLIDYEVDTIYLEPGDLSVRTPVYFGFKCEGCGAYFPEPPWLGEAAPDSMRVRWEDLVRTDWAWIVGRESIAGIEEAQCN